MNRKTTIAFIGIDGSGKTTLIKELSKKLSKEGETCKVIYMGLGSEHNFPLLKQVMAIRRYFHNESHEKNSASFRKYNYRKRGFFWVLGQYSELWIRYLKSKKYSKNSYVIFDRFFYDGLILGGKTTFNFFKYFTPRVKNSFLIKAPAKIIWERKKEAGIKEVEKYYSKAKKLESFFPIKVINNTEKINIVVEKIYNEIKKNEKTNNN